MEFKAKAAVAAAGVGGILGGVAGYETSHHLITQSDQRIEQNVTQQEACYNFVQNHPHQVRLSALTIKAATECGLPYINTFLEKQSQTPADEASAIDEVVELPDPAALGARIQREATSAVTFSRLDRREMIGSAVAGSLIGSLALVGAVLGIGTMAGRQRKTVPSRSSSTRPDLKIL